MQEMRGMHNMQGPRAMQENAGNKKKIMIIGGVIVVVVIAGVWFFRGSGEGKWVCENSEWVMKGKTDEPKPTGACNGNVASENSGERVKPSQEMLDIDSKKVAEGIDIRVKTPYVNQTITSPLKVTGEAKGWYTDKAFNVQLIDDKGTVIATGTAKASGEGDDYVAFEAELTFDRKDAKSGDIIFQKSNPTNDPAKAGTFSFPVFFE